MKCIELYNDGVRQWLFFGRDPNRPDFIIDTNQYVVLHDKHAILLDPGGNEIFPDFASSLSQHVGIGQVDSIFSSHQDPDIVSSLALWLGLKPDINCYAPQIWTSFIAHFGGGKAPIGVPDEGGPLPLGDSNDLRMIPAHYLHSSGNLHVYDPRSKILFSGDVGAAQMPPEQTAIYVEDFDAHVPFMTGFHKRWMPSNRAKNDWIKRVRTLDIQMMCPQHGAIFRGENIHRFLDWFEALEVGNAIPNEGPTG